MPPSILGWFLSLFRVWAEPPEAATNLKGARLRSLLVLSFAFVAALTVGVGTWATARVIADYLKRAEDDRVARDMDLAQAFYELKLDEVAAISHRLVLDRWVIQSLPDAIRGNSNALRIIDEQITNKITVLALGGTHLIAILDDQGNMRVARVLSADGHLTPRLSGGTWGGLPIVRDSLTQGSELAATEVIPAGLLDQVGLEQQARVELLETPKAAPVPFDPREGTAGLALVGVAPLMDEHGRVLGAALAVYLFNNDFTLVDRIKEVAGIDTVTIFFGDLRVSTNVMTESGERAVGTRISQEVYDVVLRQERDYVGQAFVVNETYVTRYAPLRDHDGVVVGSLYVGAREAAFVELVDAFNNRVAIIALVCIGLAAVIAVPISRWITRPIADLVEATGRLAQGDMGVRVPAQGRGELAQLADAFNRMVERLQDTQDRLLHKEKLASMGQLAAGVAHEINNPLGTIQLYSSAMLKSLPEADPRRDDLNTIQRETERCKVIVASLLNFARQQEVLAEETDLHALLERAIGAVKPQAIFRGVEIERCYDGDLPTIQADGSQLQQVFVNLLNNAADAMSGRGRITLRTR
ncbi:MAG TPA: cache domain-containing protein, partial [Anaerolineales bacterium]|nr:cache domain-containing protein [Anaerolineales bacterium]